MKMDRMYGGCLFGVTVGFLFGVMAGQHSTEEDPQERQAAALEEIADHLEVALPVYEWTEEGGMEEVEE